MKMFNSGASLLAMQNLTRLSHYTILTLLFIDDYMAYYILREIKYLHQ